jgi:hypothetical protein
MADKEQPQQPTHRAYSVIKRDGQEDYWLNLGLAFPHKDGKGFNIILQASPLDGKIVCRESLTTSPSKSRRGRNATAASSGGIDDGEPNWPQSR